MDGVTIVLLVNAALLSAGQWHASLIRKDIAGGSNLALIAQLSIGAALLVEVF